METTIAIGRKLSSLGDYQDVHKQIEFENGHANLGHIALKNLQNPPVCGNDLA